MQCSNDQTVQTNKFISSRENQAAHLPNRLSSVRNFFSAFKRYILCSEDDIGLQSSTTQGCEFKDREPMFVIVDSSCISNPSSQELLIEHKKGTVLKKHLNINVIPIGIPSTSRDIRETIIQPQLQGSESTDELQMIEINLQSENEISVENDEVDDESIVISYLQNKDMRMEMEGTFISTKKKSSLLEDVPKMETILEGEQFSPFPLKASSTSQLPQEVKPEDDHE